MKRASPSLLLSLALLALVTGCNHGVAPGEDRLLVTSEIELKNSLDTMNEIWKFDHQNLAWMKANAPQLHQAINNTREPNGPFWPTYDAAKASLQAYRVLRSPGAATEVSNTLTRLRDVVSTAKNLLIKAQAQRAMPTPR